MEPTAQQRVTYRHVKTGVYNHDYHTEVYVDGKLVGITYPKQIKIGDENYFYYETIDHYTDLKPRPHL